jgi:hypothetical protein
MGTIVLRIMLQGLRFEHWSKGRENRWGSRSGGRARESRPARSQGNARKAISFEELVLVGTWETLARWCDDLQAWFVPYAEKYGEHPTKEPETLRQTLFPAPRPGEFGLLRDLQSLQVLAAAVHGTITVLFQAAQGLRDRPLLEATLHAEEQIERAQAWLLTQLKHRAVASLIIPT